MSNLPMLLPAGPGVLPEPVDPRLIKLKQMVLDTVLSPHSKRNYANALDHLFLFAASRPLTRGLLMEWRAGMEKDSPSTINVRLSAMRKMVNEARRNGMLEFEEAANLTDVPNISQKGARLGNWLTRAGQGSAVGPGSLHTERQTRLRYSRTPGRLRLTPTGTGSARCRKDPDARGTVGDR